MRKHSKAQRFEEAGDVLTRIDALETVLRRVQTARELVSSGTFSFEASARLGDGATGVGVAGAGVAGAGVAGAGVAGAGGTAAISYRVECGLLRATHVGDEMFQPVAPKLPRDLSEFFMPPSLGDAAEHAISAELIDEILCIARHVRTSATSCTG
jgi:hypothetical protein